MNRITALRRTGRVRRLPQAALGAAVLASAVAFLPVRDVQGQDTETPVLPNLAPREVEIRGQLEISFPSLQRQPLIGFNPPPRVPEIPRSRRPITEDYTDAGSDVDRSLLQPPDPPAVARFGSQTPLRGEAEVSAGSYFGRRVRVIAAVPLSGSQELRGEVDYRGSNGMTLQDHLDGVKNPADDLAAHIEYGKTSSALSFGTWVRGHIDSYNLYGLVPADGSLVQSAPDRNAGNYALGVRVGAGPNSGVDFKVELGVSGEDVKSELFSSSDIQDPGTERKESRGFASAHVATPAGRGVLYFDAAGETAGIDTDGFLGSSVQQAEFAVGYGTSSDKLRWSAGGRLLKASFDGDVGGMATSDRRSATYLSADLDLRYSLNRSVELFAVNRPGVVSNGLGDLFAASPYLVSEPAMQPSISTIDGRTGIKFSSRDLQLVGWVTYEQSPNLLYFTNSTGSGPSTVETGFFEAGYQKARVITTGGEFGWSLRSGIQITLGGRFVSSKLQVDNVRIPYVPKIEGWLGVTVPFLSARGLFQATGRYAGSRFADVAQTAEVSPFLSVDLYAHYDFTERVGVVVRLDRLSPSGKDTLWDGYPQTANVFMIGARFLW